MGVGGNVTGRMPCTVTCHVAMPSRRGVLFHQHGYRYVASYDNVGYYRNMNACWWKGGGFCGRMGVFLSCAALTPRTNNNNNNNSNRSGYVLLPCGSVSVNASLLPLDNEEEDDGGEGDKHDSGNHPGRTDTGKGGYVEVGIIGPPHGVQGECKVQPLTDWPEERLGKKGARYLIPPSTNKMIKSPATMKNTTSSNGIAEERKVMLMRGRASIYKGREVWIVKIKGINSPEEVQAIRGYALCVHESVREDLEDEDEFYVQQLIGLRVVELESGADVGIVADIMDGTGSHDVLCITMETGETALVPFAKEIVPEIDMENGVMRISPPEGLLDIYRKKTKK